MTSESHPQRRKRKETKCIKSISKDHFEGLMKAMELFIPKLTHKKYT